MNNKKSVSKSPWMKMLHTINVVLPEELIKKYGQSV